MKILYVVRDLKGKGGIQSFAKSATESLKGKHDITLRDWRTPHTYFQEGLVRVLPSFISKQLYKCWFRQSVKHVLGDESVDLVHFWHIKSPMAVIDTITTPYILTCHGSEVLTSNVGEYQRDKFLKALHKARAITTPSNYTKQYLIEHYSVDHDKITVINPAIDTSIFTPKAAHKKADTITIGTITRLIPRKNVVNIVKALNILSNRRNNIQYLLAGGGSKIQTAKVLRALRKATFTWKYLGRISDEEKRDSFYPSLDIFVLPPLYKHNDFEGFGIVFLEANASGVPVVAANTGGVGDAVNEKMSGIFADPNDPQDIAAKIEEMIVHKSEYSKLAPKWADNFTTAVMANKFDNLYKSLIS